MQYFSAKMHKIQFRLGLRSSLGSSHHSLDFLEGWGGADPSQTYPLCGPPSLMSLPTPLGRLYVMNSIDSCVCLFVL